MLARSFLTAADLGIPEAWRDALITTLYAFERGEIPEEKFDMTSVVHVEGPYCGTPACILGWASHLSNGAFGDVRNQFPDGVPSDLEALFAVDICDRGRDADTLVVRF